MKRAFLSLVSLAVIAGCNAINGFEDLEKVDCVGESCADSNAPDTFVAESDSPDTARPDTEVPDTALPDTDVPDTTDAATDTIDDGDAPVDGGPCGAPSRACYPGPDGTAGKGACVMGTQYCVDGDWGPCIGAVTPSLETCNNIDDDCNGSIDDGLPSISCGVGACKKTVSSCTAGAATACAPNAATTETCNGTDDDCDGAIDEDNCSCIYVAPTGLDTNAGTTAAPMKTINAAIAKAVSGTIKRVCVASGETCGTTVDYPEAVVMKNGVSVYGGYQATGTVWPRATGCATRITAQNARGVYFDAAVVSPTILDGFTITGASLTTNAAITIEGSRGAIVNNVIVNGGSGTTSIGIDVLESGETRATPTISRSTINGGTGSSLAVGVRSYRSTPTLQDLCDTYDSGGRCNVSSPCSSTGFGIRGRANITGTTQRSYGVFLTDSPNAVVARAAICGGSGSVESNGIRLAGDLTNTRVNGNAVRTGGAPSTAGVHLDACADGSPWLFNNFDLAGESSSTSGRADGVRVTGGCHPRIDSNLTIIGSRISGSTVDARGIYCARDASTMASSRCAITSNATILGSSSTTAPAVATGIHCDDGSCLQISRNGRIAGTNGSAQTATGISVGNSGVFIHDNLIETGCATKEGGAFVSRDSFARLSNNVLRGLVCTSSSSAPSFAAKLLFATGRNEVDLHSNTLFAQGFATTCTSRALWLDVITGSPGGPRGLFRNNIFNAGVCSTSYHVDEAVPNVDPRVFKNNDLWSAPVTALYNDEGATALITIGAVNALSDATFADNISADPVFTTGYHIGPTSACIDKGTSEGAPAIDFDGDPRPLGMGHDIGADEVKP